MARRPLSFFSRILLLINLLAVVALLLSYLASFISPEKYWIMGLFGLSYPFMLIINGVFIIYWLIALRLNFLISFVAILIGFTYIINTFHIPGIKRAHILKGKTVKVLSYNVRLFDLYNWTKDGNTKTNMLRFLKKASPDIFCAQEFYTSETPGNVTDSLTLLLKAPYHHTVLTENGTENHWGMSIFSRYPIINTGKISFKVTSNNMCIYADVKIGEQMFRVYNVHFQSIGFENEDYQFVKNIEANKEQKELEGSMKILRRLKIAFIKRAKQADMVAESIKKSPYPVIVCGDFNDTPSSYTYHVIRESLRDAFVESGRGFGNTYNGIFPSFRIDYILHDNAIKSSGYKTLHRNYSDHFPIMTYIQVAH